MEKTYWAACSEKQKKQLLQRPALADVKTLQDQVANILETVKERGDQSLFEFSAKFDKTTLTHLRLDKTTVNEAVNRVDAKFKQAIEVAYTNLTQFHKAQQRETLTVETLSGVTCQQVFRPISSVGLYIPGGSAPLFSTVLMLAIPALIAGCKRIVLCSPPPIADEILYVAQKCGIDEIYQLGGAQAVAALAYGTETITSVDKIFGPGNSFVTEAKRQVSQDRNGCAIDMPAGPSEVLVIADETANPEFIAADLLSQAEHGPDSQVILVTPVEEIAQQVKEALAQQLKQLPRAEITEKALGSSRIIITQSLDECIAISNDYAPEHLIIQTKNADDVVNGIDHAGSVFLGLWSPESVGDYASGTNHVLPTYGYAKTYSSLGLADFQKRMTVQKLSEKGLRNLASTVELMAEREQLFAHKNAVTLRINYLNSMEVSS